MFLPKVTFTTTDVGGKLKVASAKVEIYFFDRTSGDDGAFVKLENVGLFNRLIDETPRLEFDDYGGFLGNGHSRLSASVPGVTTNCRRSGSILVAVSV